MLYDVLIFINNIGSIGCELVADLGDFSLFGYKFFFTLFKKKIHKKQLMDQMYVIGIQSFGIVFLTGCFSGLALTVQSYTGLSRLHAEQFTGLVAIVALTRELAPVLTGIITSARTGSAIAAELGTMRITEQIDALTTLLIDPYAFLVVPRMLATTIMLPFMTFFAMVFGIISGYCLSVYVFAINEIAYISIVREHIVITDITGGLIKAFIFGFLISWVGTYLGYYASNGARGVGRATTQSVVVGSMLILVGNYIITSLLIRTGLS
jgi:phospholipid/cholesterol/gamma-HCH transport system permease protein